MTIYLCGDSTMASYTPEEAPLVGWGQVLKEWLPELRIENRAMPGRSTKSFLAEGRLQQIEKVLKAGDIVVIQFGHNDESELVWRHTDPWIGYAHNLGIFMDTARMYGAVPILMTPLCRRTWRSGKLVPSHGDYPQAMRLAAGQRNVPVIDAYAASQALLSRLGEEESKKLFMHLDKGACPTYPDGLADDTHTRRAGAEAFARIALDGLMELGLISGGCI